jgi:hypothetical protein
MTGLRLIIMALVVGALAACAAAPRGHVAQLDCDCCAPPGAATAPFKWPSATPHHPASTAPKGAVHVS